jgi:hypothetical protein
VVQLCIFFRPGQPQRASAFRLSFLGLRDDDSSDSRLREDWSGQKKCADAPLSEAAFRNHYLT